MFNVINNSHGKVSYLILAVWLNRETFLTIETLANYGTMAK